MLVRNQFNVHRQRGGPVLEDDALLLRVDLDAPSHDSDRTLVFLLLLLLLLLLQQLVQEENLPVLD